MQPPHAELAEDVVPINRPAASCDAVLAAIPRCPPRQAHAEMKFALHASRPMPSNAIPR